MKARIKTVKDGFEVSFEIEHDDRQVLIKNLPRFISELQEAGYKPNGSREWATTPTGEPICPKHGTPMRKREKQGDIWYSHSVTGTDGQEHYCRGYQDKSSPGWEF